MVLSVSVVSVIPIDHTSVSLANTLRYLVVRGLFPGLFMIQLSVHCPVDWVTKSVSTDLGRTFDRHTDQS